MAKNITALKDAAQIINQLIDQDMYEHHLVHIDQNGDIARMPNGLTHGSMVLAISDDEYHTANNRRCFVGYAIDRDLADENVKPFVNKLKDWESTMILTHEEMADNYLDLLHAIEVKEHAQVTELKGVSVRDINEAIGVITNKLQRDGMKMDEFEIYQENHINGNYFVAFTGTPEEPHELGSGDTYKWRLDKTSGRLVEEKDDADKFYRDGCDIAENGKKIDHQKIYQGREIDCKNQTLQEVRKNVKTCAKVKDKALTM